MVFNEANTAEQMVLDSCQAAGWTYVSPADLGRQAGDVLVEARVREAIIRLNPEIAEQPDRADEVLYRLRTIPLAVQTYGRYAFAPPRATILLRPLQPTQYPCGWRDLTSRFRSTKDGASCS